MAHFDYHSAHSWNEAIDLWQQYGDDAMPIAGGTNLMIQLAQGRFAVPHVISLTRIPAWDHVEVNGNVTLGAGATYRQVRHIEALQGARRSLLQAANHVGNTQVRNVGTIVGNICNASPAADSVPPLLTMDAYVTLVGPDGTRTLAIEDFILGPNQTALQHAEFVQSITLPELPLRTSTVYMKASRRQAMAISSVSVATRITMAEDNHCQIARIALGAVAATPKRIHGAEQLLQGQLLTSEALQGAADLAADAIEPVSDVRASAAYRRHLARTMVRRALEACVEQLK